MDAIKIINKYFKPETKAHALLVAHSSMVAKIALEAAKRVSDKNPDLDFIYEAAMLHDIGICRVRAKIPGCQHHGPDYIHHGYLGREILEQEGLPVHGLVCERHVGVGITKKEAHGLDLPCRNMIPVTLEEKLICYADKFHSKNGHTNGVILSVDEIMQRLEAFGPDKPNIFRKWVDEFGVP